MLHPPSGCASHTRRECNLTAARKRIPYTLYSHLTDFDLCINQDHFGLWQPSCAPCAHKAGAFLTSINGQQTHRTTVKRLSGRPRLAVNFVSTTISKQRYSFLSNEGDSTKEPTMMPTNLVSNRKFYSVALCTITAALLAGCLETDREYADRVCRMGGHAYGTTQYSQCYQSAFGQAQARSTAMVQTGTAMMSSPQPSPSVTCRRIGNTTTCQ